MWTVFGAAARHGRQLLILGLVAGLLAPGLAEAIRPWVAEMVAALLCVTAVRVGARHAFGHLGTLRPTLLRVLVLQALLPVSALAAGATVGLLGAALPLAVVLMLSAPSLTGAPNLAIMAGQDPVPGMRLVVIGTALFPLTALPVLTLLDLTGEGAAQSLLLALRLLATILAAAGLGFLLRGIWPRLGDATRQPVLDGAAALLLAIVVVGLMAAVGPLLRSAPMELLWWLAAALLVNLGLVVSAYWISVKAGLSDPFSTAIYAGNRNIALFLLVLPDAASAPLMLFIGCYQVPMYLTPYLVSALARWRIQ